ncbi:MAG TPA: ABC transporter ATP-binding protein [Bacilli bacterium]|nr:ABC transporter ATP-binding protein [Acholeplasmataceae bacterium]HOE78139.1 ABC transporter ATP-binding protein [Bacilli bacterium]HON64150.1 ABC transporter ATP-binding protein [Bacilli bacterium]HOR96539.1 ABC transporter ATP-binding protein [Bacilli bacterium]HPD12764.1 ABC transporter ATP-binding protein [Bacilli bacterium]
MEKIIEVKNLAISFKTQYGILKAVRGVSFDLYRGETLAIVGESGSGKSVTSRAIMGLLAGNAIYESGSIMYGGRDLMSIPEEMFHEIRGSKISMIFQDPMSSLNPIQTVGKQISEALIFKMGMTKEMAKRKAIELMEQVGIPNAEKRYNQYPFQFSGGMRQRIVISIALANNAEVIICDEPTTALDVTIQGQILELLDRLKAERNLSVIFITHDLGVVANVANRIAVMYAGKIVEIGTAEEIFYDPKHPYTWALLSSMPILATSKHLDAISGTPPNMIYPPKGDAFAPRNKYALQIDFEEEPPFFKVSDTHYAATWLLHPDAPKVEVPDSVKRLQENRGKIKK